MSCGMHMRFGWNLGRNPDMEAVGALHGAELQGCVTSGSGPRKGTEIAAAESHHADLEQCTLTCEHPICDGLHSA